MTGNTGEVKTQVGTTAAEIVRTFLDSMAAGDQQAVLALVDPNIEYTNVGTPTLRGKKRIEALLASMSKTGMGFGVEFVNVAEDGPVVLTERIDELSLGRFRMQFWVCGRFEVVDGLITVWRDYFDYLDMAKAAVKGLVGIVVPGLQKPLGQR